MLLSVNVPYDIPCPSVPSLYHALVRSHGPTQVFDQQLYLPLLLQWLYHIPLNNNDNGTTSTAAAVAEGVACECE
jgi:hypothetical protein